MRNTFLVLRRELSGYFATPLAYVFIVIYLTLSGALTFFAGGFFERNEADLRAFFLFVPWLFLFLMPAIGMRLWAEERKSGTIELLLTLPITTGQAVLGKFLAAWGFATLALALTGPLWLTVNYLGEPDNGVILASYAGAWLMSGAFLALSSCISALTKNQVIAFVVGASVSFLFMMSGLPIVLSAFSGWAPRFVTDMVSSLSFLTQFSSVTKGVLDARTVFYFVSLIAVSLFANAAIIDLKKGS
jgi:ABC-2 type transport system permease protein